MAAAFVDHGSDGMKCEDRMWLCSAAPASRKAYVNVNVHVNINVNNCVNACMSANATIAVFRVDNGAIKLSPFSCGCGCELTSYCSMTVSAAFLASQGISAWLSPAWLCKDWCSSRLAAPRPGLEWMRVTHTQPHVLLSKTKPLQAYCLVSSLSDRTFPYSRKCSPWHILLGY